MNESFESSKTNLKNSTISRFEAIISGSRNLIVYPLFFPFLMILYVTTSSIMNKSSSGIIYILGLTFTMFNNLLVNSLEYPSIDEKIKNDMKNELCYTGIPFVPKNNNISSPNTAVIVFTYFFFLSPAFLRNMHFIRSPVGLFDFFFTKYLEVTIFFAVVLFINGYSEKILRCSNSNMNGLDLVNGMLIGMFSSWLFVLLFYVTGNKNVIINNTFLKNQVVCDVPKNKMFKCDKGANVPKIAFSINQRLQPIVDEIYFYGNSDLSYLKTLKNYSTYNHIHIFGKTGLIIYNKENFKGEKMLIKYKDLRGFSDIIIDEEKDVIIISKTNLLNRCNWFVPKKNKECTLTNFKSIESVQLIKDNDF